MTWLDRFVPSDDATVSAIMALADLRPGDRLIDLGSGDGRILRAAVARGATAVGYEIDEELARKSAAVMPPGATVVHGDLRAADLGGATVVVAMVSAAHLGTIADVVGEVRCIVPRHTEPGVRCLKP